MQLALNAVLFCFVGGFLFAKGFALGSKPKKAKRVKITPKPLTPEQERQAERQKREEENFWAYDGTRQE